MAASEPIPADYTAVALPHLKLQYHTFTDPSLAAVTGDVTTPNPTLPSLPSPILIIFLSRPDRHNTFTGQMATSLVQAFTWIDQDARIKACVLAGDPASPSFCGGADVTSEFKRDTRVRPPSPSSPSAHTSPNQEHTRTDKTSPVWRDGGGVISLAIHRCRKPVFAAIHGSAVGVGITMTLPATARVAYRGSKIGFVFARRGLVNEACSTYFLPRLIGYSKATFLSVTGKIVRADDRLVSDLFCELVDNPEDVLPRTLRLAEDVVVNTSLVSTCVIKDAIWNVEGEATPEKAHLLESELIHSMFESRDNIEGVMSFLQKRTPKFTGTLEDDLPKAYLKRKFKL